MRFTQLNTLVLATLCTLPIAAQQPDTPQPQPSPQAAPQAAPSPVQLSAVTTELTGNLNSKTAKAGDSVVLKTTEKATMADGTVIPKGAKITGHVMEAQAHAGDSENGRVTLQFDQAELKSGQNMPIKSALQTVSPAPGSSAGDSGGSASMPMAGGASSAPSGGSSASGASQQATAPSASGSAAASPSGSPSGGSQQSGPAPGTTVARNGNVVIRTTSVPGVLVAASADGQPFSNASGALIAAQQDVKLDGGTKVVLEVADSGTAPAR